MTCAAGCSGGSADPSGGTQPPITAPPSGQASLEPAFSPPAAAVDHPLPVTAVMTTPSGQRIALRSPASDPADVFAAPGGKFSVQLSTSGSAGATFNLSGAAATGRALTTDRVSLTGPGGLYADSTYPDLARCTTQFSEMSAKAMAGAVTCEMAEPVTGTVKIQFRTG